MTYIYALSDPRDKSVRYIGRTTNLQERLAFHYESIHDFQGTCARKVWIRELVAETGMFPECTVLQSCNGDGKSEEQFWIEYHRKKGSPLLNRPAHNSQERNSQLSKSIKKSWEWSRAYRCKPMSQETKDKIAAGVRAFNREKRKRA